jgi:hypothetical protein
MPRAGEEPFGCGGNLLVRRSSFLEAGGFDERYFSYFEDVDLGWRLWAGGERVIACPDATLRHRLSATSERLGNSRRGSLFERNALWTVVKNLEGSARAAAARRAPHLLARLDAMPPRVVAAGARLSPARRCRSGASASRPARRGTAGAGEPRAGSRFRPARSIEVAATGAWRRFERFRSCPASMRSRASVRGAPAPAPDCELFSASRSGSSRPTGDDRLFGRAAFASWLPPISASNARSGELVAL